MVYSRCASSPERQICVSPSMMQPSADEELGLRSGDQDLRDTCMLEKALVDRLVSEKICS